VTRPRVRPLLVSVIVPVRDGGDDLPSLLAALARQTLDPSSFEVIFSDDGSEDGSIERLDAGHGNLRVVVGPRSTSYAARNRGARVAEAPVLAFTDADCRPEPDWLARGLASLEGKGADVLAGVVRFTPPRRVHVWGLLDMDAYLDQERMVRQGVAATANLLVRRDVFDAAGGFDPALPSNGDHDFVARCVAAGRRLAFARDAAVTHPVRNDRRAFLAKWWRTHTAFGARCARDGRPTRMWLLLVPGVRTWRSRRWHARPPGLNLARLAESGVRPGPLQRLAALPLLYLVLPWIAFAAQATGRRRSRRGAAPPRVSREMA
jgi:glycosyltransferase involved in cell wall biosynthesis